MNKCTGCKWYQDVGEPDGFMCILEEVCIREQDDDE